MRERTHLSPAWMLAFVIACGASVAVGQQIGAPGWPAEAAYTPPTDAGNSIPQGSGPQTYPVSSSAFNAPEKDLAADVAELKATVKKMKDKEEADKKKAAGAITAKIGGRVYYDTVWFGQDAASRAPSPVGLGDAQDTSFFRTTRLFAEGEGFGVAYYKAEIDFAGRSDFNTSPVGTHVHTNPEGGDTGAAGSHSHTVSGIGQILFKDVYLGIRDLPILGRVQAGHFKEPISLEELTSSRFITFMERGLPNVLIPGRNLGIMAMRVAEGENASIAFGCFRQVGENPPYLASDDGGTDFVGRVTWLPWYDEATDGRGVLHLGMAYRYLDVSDPTQRLAARAECGAGPNVVDTNLSTLRITNVENTQTVGPEIAFVYGPFSAQAEYMGSLYKRAGVQDYYANGAYVYVSYFLTGENRHYSRQRAAFDRVKPFTNVFRVRTEDGYVQTGWGAWEVAYRFSYLDLDDAAAGILGGNAHDHTIGVNWYLNPNMRVMADYVHCNTSLPQNNPNVFLDCFMLRAQVDF